MTTPHPHRAIPRSALALLVASLAVFAPASAEPAPTATGVPSLIAYEGLLADANGRPIADGSYEIHVSLYDQPEGGSPIWTERHVAPVAGGLVHLTLGQGDPESPLDLAFDRPYYLGVRIADEPEMRPRTLLTAAPYSLTARVAETVPDASLTAAKIAPGAVTNEKIAGVDWDKLTGAPPAWLTDAPAPGADPGLSNDPPGPFRTWHPAMRKTFWSVWGNRSTVPAWNYVGNADSLDLDFRTNDQQRFAITADGQVVVEHDLTVKRDLNVGRDVAIGRDASVGRDLWVKRSLAIGDSASDPSTFPLDVRNRASGNRFSIDDQGRVRVTSERAGADGDAENYPLLVDAVDQGIAVRVDGHSNATHDYVSFWDDDGMAGRIEGNDAVDQLTSPQWILFTTLAAIDIGTSIANQTAAATSTTPCVGAGACETLPIASLNVAAGLEIAAAIAKEAAYQAFLFAQLGVAYQSGAGDYAEWLPREDVGERLEPGDIVGVRGGRVTKATVGAEQRMVVSRSPAVLGNMPPAGERHRFEKIAFMGQVPVRVTGPVRTGDYILPSGLDDGTGIAVTPELMTANDFARAVGRAWSSSDRGFTKLVNVVVGVSSGDVATALSKQEGRIRALEATVDRLSRAVERSDLPAAANSAGPGVSRFAGADQ